LIDIDNSIIIRLPADASVTKSVNFS